MGNACGVIALIHSVLNNPQVPLQEGSPLEAFRDANLGVSPEDRATSLEGFKAIHDMYKAKASEGNQSNQDGVHIHDGVAKTFHFVAYVRNADNQLLELDGTKQGPWVVAEGISEEAFMGAVAQEMQRRLTEGEIDPAAASLMAFGPDLD